MEEILKCIQSNQFIVLVVSDSFVVDKKCREVTSRACALRPEAVFPIGMVSSKCTTGCVVQTSGRNRTFRTVGQEMEKRKNS